jgi:hypothetical protein
MKTKLNYTLLVLLALMWCQPSFAQEAASTSGCQAPVLLENLHLHLPEQAGSYLLFDRLPQQASIITETGILVRQIDSKSIWVNLNPNTNYRLVADDGCGQSVILDSWNLTEKEQGDFIPLPARLYEAVAENARDERGLTLFDFLQSNTDLKPAEKLFLIQEYYFNGSLNTAPNGDPFDIPFENGFENGGLEFEDGIDKLGDFIDDVLWEEPTKDCHCQGFMKMNQLHHIDNGHSLNPLTFKPVHVNEGKVHFGSSDRYTHEEYKVIGASKTRMFTQYMKRSNSRTFERYYPDATNAISPYITSLSFSMICEDQNRQRDDCQCADRRLRVAASYISELKTNGKKLDCFWCGQGWKYSSDIEDWAVLTKASKKTGIGILDAGRLSASSNHNVTYNPDWNLKVSNLSVNVVKSIALIATGTSAAALIDSSIFKQLTDDIDWLLANKSHTGYGSSKDATGELLGGTGGRTYTVELLPNDPTYISIASFTATKLYGHTKWKATANVQSTAYLVGHIARKTTDECCTDESYAWIVGGEPGTPTHTALKGVNFFLHAEFAQPISFPNHFGKEYTENNQFGSERHDLCANHWNSPRSVVKESVPTRTQVIVSNILTGEVYGHFTIEKELSIEELKLHISQKFKLKSGFYSIKLTNSNIPPIKIYRP